jgi:hypothetical protein
MIVSDYFQLDDLHTVRYRTRGPGVAALLYISRDFRVQFRVDGELVTYTVPAGTPTDFASIPQAAQALISKLGPHIEAAVVHDRLCIDRGFWRPGRDPWSSRVCAEIFWRGMLAGGTDEHTAYLMYRCVRRFGPQWGVQQGGRVFVPVPVA